MSEYVMPRTWNKHAAASARASLAGPGPIIPGADNAGRPRNPFSAHAQHSIQSTGGGVVDKSCIIVYAVRCARTGPIPLATGRCRVRDGSAREAVD
jgi:hypothetical protein